MPAPWLSLSAPSGRAIILLTAIVAAALAARPGQAVTFLTVESPPVSFAEQGKIQGSAAGKVRDVANGAGVPVTVEVVPRDNAYVRAQGRKDVCLFATARVENRKRPDHIDLGITGLNTGRAAARTAKVTTVKLVVANDEPFSRGLLYRIDKRGVAPSYVFGTVHSADARVTVLPKPVAEAFGGAKTLALEIQLGEGDSAEFFAATQFDDSRRLTDFFDAASLAAIRAALGAGAPANDVFLRLKPWAVLLRLGEQPVAGAGETLDAKLQADARRRRLNIIGLELPDEQISAFDAIPLATQVALVHFVLSHRGALARDHDAVIAAWLARDLARLAALSLAPGRENPALAPHFAELARHLVENRSVQMAHRLFLPLRAGRVFVAVGALHLHGRRGLLTLLQEQGYRVSIVY